MASTSSHVSFPLPLPTIPPDEIMPLKDIQAHPSLFLGPGFAAAFVEAIGIGIILSQFYTFQSRWSNESRIIKILAVFVTTVAM